MNKKHMNAQLCKVFDRFAESITDEILKSKVKNGTIITGGAIVSLLQGEKPNDYDLYFKDFDTCYSVALYYAKQFSESHNRSVEVKLKTGKEKYERNDKWITFIQAKQELEDGLQPQIKIFIKSLGVAGESDGEDEELTESDDMQTNIEPDTNMEEKLEEKPEFVAKFLTSNAISLSGKIQLVIRFYGEPDKIHENYDYVHCTNYWTSWERKVTLKQEALEAIINKELIYVGSKYPLCSIIRTRKFIKRGWTINAGQYLKMCMQLNELNLNDVEVLEDQLVGVDSTFFNMLINALKAKQEAEPNFELNRSYVAAIIDKIF